MLPMSIMKSKRVVRKVRSFPQSSILAVTLISAKREGTTPKASVYLLSCLVPILFLPQILPPTAHLAFLVSQHCYPVLRESLITSIIYRTALTIADSFASTGKGCFVAIHRFAKPPCFRVLPYFFHPIYQGSDNSR
jgi:hypothetical protein